MIDKKWKKRSVMDEKEIIEAALSVGATRSEYYVEMTDQEIVSLCRIIEAKTLEREALEYDDEVNGYGKNSASSYSATMCANRIRALGEKQ